MTGTPRVLSRIAARCLIDSGLSRSAFKHTFLKIVVKEISWHFVPHREEDSIQDSRIEK